jgi:hypothetical protein
VENTLPHFRHTLADFVRRVEHFRNCGRAAAFPEWFSAWRNGRPPWPKHSNSK